jgi:hypothetical protein
MDNGLDFCHIHYVHESRCVWLHHIVCRLLARYHTNTGVVKRFTACRSFGNPDKPEVHDMRVPERDAFSIRGGFRIHNKPSHPLLEGLTKLDSVPVEYTAFLPSTSATRVTLAGGSQMITFVATTPVDAERATVRLAFIRNFARSPLLDGIVRRSAVKVLNEDKVCVCVCVGRASACLRVWACAPCPDPAVPWMYMTGRV